MTEKKMVVTSSTVKKVVIEGAPALDPITVFLEDFAPKNGKITVSCYGKSWTAHWGGMWEGLTVAEFFPKLGDDYIVGYFDSELKSTQFSATELVKLTTKEIIKRRRQHDLNPQEARAWYSEAADLKHAESIELAYAHHNEIMTNVFGNEWWHWLDQASEPNPDYQYLCRIIAAVQEALRTINKEKTDASQSENT